MSEDPKETIQRYVETAFRSRIDEGTKALGNLKEEILGVLGRFEEKLEAVGQEPVTIPDEIIPQPPPDADQRGILTHMLSSQQEMLAATDQVGLLTQLLLACTVSCPRVAFFIVKKETAVGWAARGFEGAQDTDVRNLSIGVQEETILGSACRSGGTARGGPGAFAKDREFFSPLGGETPADALAVPIFIRDKVVAILYGDSGREDQIADPEVPEILAYHAGLCLETLATRQKYPRPKPALRRSRAEAEPAAPPEPAPAPQSAVASSPAVSSQAAPAPQSASLSGILQSQAVEAPAARPPEAPAAPPPPTPEVEEVEEIEEEVKLAPPAPAETPAVDLDGLPEEERRSHEEARRFARLLVSEIVLYNEKQAEEGRRNKDIYERLKEDIDRSLQMYEQRVSAKVRASSNYFYEELVRTLANGDVSAIKVPWA
jgi:hypothetical protein